jgi:hypothetical protein
MVSVYVNVSGYTSSQIKAYRDEHFTNQAEVLAQKDRKNKKGGPAVQAHIRWRLKGLSYPAVSTHWTVPTENVKASA